MYKAVLRVKLMRETKFHKSLTDLWEEKRFQQAADRFDYQNYYSFKPLKTCDFLSLVDLLYSLENYHMLMKLLVRYEKTILASPIPED